MGGPIPPVCQQRGEFIKIKWRLELPNPPVMICKEHYFEFTQMGGVWTDEDGNVLDNQDKPKRVWLALEKYIQQNE